MSRLAVLTEDGRTCEVEETKRYMRVAVVGGENDSARVDKHRR